MPEITQEELLQNAQENLPDEYISALSSINLPERIDDVGRRNNLSDDEIELLDQEIMYLLLNITGSADYTERLSEGLDVSNDQLFNIIKQTTRDIVEPLEKKINDDNNEGDVVSMPVPPPPPAPSAGYGGTSDPYREPTDR